MPSPRSAPPTLSANDIRQITDELAEGRPPTVWFTEAAVGVPEGRSGKVVSVGDPAEGDFLQIRPAGSKDVMSFSPTEVTLTKPARKDKRTSASESAPRKGTAVSTSSTSTPAVSAPVAPAVAEPAAAAPQSPAKTSAAASGAA
ncbi:MAG: hypothetical protein J2P18_13460, partial [Nocardia sp.]|nr:hypothetical protein [Nocardia sp.]